MEHLSSSPIELTARVLSCAAFGKLAPDKQTGTVKLTEDDVSWASLTAADLHLRFLLSDIVDLQKTPDSQPNAKLRVLLGRDKGSGAPLVFDFVTGAGAPDKASRETFIAVRNELRRAALSSAPDLGRVHSSVVHRDGVSEAEFWTLHQQLLVDAGLSRRKPALSSAAPDLVGRATGASSSNSGAVLRLSLDSATLAKICRLEPHVLEAYKRFVPVPLGAKEFWTFYYQARQHWAERDAEAATSQQRPAALQRGRGAGGGAANGWDQPAAAAAAPRPVSTLQTPAEFFDAYRKGAYSGAGQALALLGLGGLAAGSKSQMLTAAEAAGLSGQEEGRDGAGYGTREAGAAYAADARAQRAFPVPSAQQAEAYSRAAWAAGRVIEEANRYSRLVLASEAQPGGAAAPLQAAGAVGAVAQAAATVAGTSSGGAAAQPPAPDDLEGDLGSGGADPAEGLAPLATDLGGLRAVLAAGRAEAAATAAAAVSGVEPGNAALRALPPPVDLNAPRAVAAAREALGELTRSAHDLFEARRRGARGLPTAVPSRWRRWVVAHFSALQELLPHLWSALTATRPDEATRERRDRLLRRLSELHADLDRVKRAIIEKGAMAMAPPSLAVLGGGGGTTVAATLDADEVEDVTGGPDAAQAAKEGLLGLINALQATLAPSILQAESVQAGLPLQAQARWK